MISTINKRFMLLYYNLQKWWDKWFYDYSQNDYFTIRFLQKLLRLSCYFLSLKKTFFAVLLLLISELPFPSLSFCRSATTLATSAGKTGEKMVKGVEKMYNMVSRYFWEWRHWQKDICIGEYADESYGSLGKEL